MNDDILIIGTKNDSSKTCNSSTTASSTSLNRRDTYYHFTPSLPLSLSHSRQRMRADDDLLRLSSSNDINPEANLPQFRSIENESTIEDESRFRHRVVNLLPVESFEFVPFGSDDDSLRSDARLLRRFADRHLRFD